MYQNSLRDVDENNQHLEVHIMERDFGKKQQNINYLRMLFSRKTKSISSNTENMNYT